MQLIPPSPMLPGDRPVSRPLSWLPCVKHRRPEAHTAMPRPGQEFDDSHRPMAPPVIRRGRLHVLSSRTTSRADVGFKADTPLTSRGSIEPPSVTSTEAASHDREWAESLRSLIRDTENAFQAVRDVLDYNTKHDASKTRNKTCTTTRIKTRSKTRKTWLFGLYVKSTHPPAASPPVQRAPSPLDKPLPPHPSTEAEQGRRPAANEKRKANKSRRDISNKATSMWKGLSNIRGPARWVDQILTDAGLKKIEADEMVTQEQIRQFREARLRAEQLQLELEAQQSSDESVFETDSSRTSQGSASTALSSDHLSLCSNSPSQSMPFSMTMDPMDHAVVHKDFSLPMREREDFTLFRQQQEEEQQHEQQLRQRQRQREREQDRWRQQSSQPPPTPPPPPPPPVRPKSVQLPDLPPKNPERSNKRPTRLATIPEAEPDCSDNGDECSQGVPSGDFGQDPAYDNHGYDSDTSLYEEDEEETAEEMAAWFESFGFESHGQLIREDTIASRSCSDLSATLRCPPSPRSSTYSYPLGSSASGGAVHCAELGVDGAKAMPTDMARYASTGPMRFLTAPGPPRVWALSKGQGQGSGRGSAGWYSSTGHRMRV
ncbi:hypothetical protein E4U22_000203 [Claviceps purpurea]|nr:hypothetical protein E4U28_003469 [Claviceps purpurea]KAG6141209.1 hypothetical protein E4U12_005126 [Claviceps purpurea]KAG6215467.1 hypothetical protein E4U50_007457 [Claviceps purpurea]KAG6322344.1 hypothetical protein E4U22_000203 [Claviceps purpurea]